MKWLKSHSFYLKKWSLLPPTSWWEVQEQNDVGKWACRRAQPARPAACITEASYQGRQQNPGDQDSGEWRSKQELQPGHNRELGWFGLALKEKWDKLPFPLKVPEKIVLKWTKADTWTIIQKTIQSPIFSSTTYQVVLNSSFTTEV